MGLAMIVGFCVVVAIIVSLFVLGACRVAGEYDRCIEQQMDTEETGSG